MSAPGLLGAASLKRLLHEANVRPRKRFGQNFVIDPNTIRKVLDVAELDDRARVLEIGAGVGSLTVGLAARVASVTAIEIDENLLPLLERSVAGTTNVHIVHADVMKMDLAVVDAEAVVANLPYNLAASIVLQVLFDAPQISSLTVMTQREVGERLAAAPGSRVYGQTSVLVAFHAAARAATAISRRAFYPVPDVDSVLVRIERRAHPEVDVGRFRSLVRAAFAQRRKTLRNALATVVSDEDVFRRAAVAPEARAEQVDVEGYVRLARALST